MKRKEETYAKQVVENNATHYDCDWTYGLIGQENEGM